MTPAGQKGNQVDPAFRHAPSKENLSQTETPHVPEVNISKMEEEGATRPHQDSYFLPGKIGGRNVQCLLDSGCMTNILSKHVFD